jgi:hypothetical protein
MKKIVKFLIFFLLLQPTLIFAQPQSKKYEVFGIATAFLALGGFVVGFYFYYSNQKEKKRNNGEKYVVRTIETYKNGRKVIMTKKYRVVEEEEYPSELKRSPRAASVPNRRR